MSESEGGPESEIAESKEKPQEEKETGEEIQQSIEARGEEGGGKGEEGGGKGEAGGGKGEAGGAAEELLPVEGKEVPLLLEKKSKAKVKPHTKKKGESDLTTISKQLEKQGNLLAKIEKILSPQPLQKHLKNADKQLEMLKGLQIAMKQLQKQMVQIQKAIQTKKASITTTTTRIGGRKRR
jgi:hypothetical protein